MKEMLLDPYLGNDLVADFDLVWTSGRGADFGTEGSALFLSVTMQPING